MEIDMGLSDPDVLLSIDKESMVVSAYLPTKVPLMQIMADLFGASSNSSSGPGLMMTDIVREQTSPYYCLRNCSSPHVARWLRDMYLAWPKKFVGVGADEEDDVGLRAGK